MDKGEFYREARGDLTGPLDGVRVVEATTAWAGPMAACLLGDLGADVVRIDLPGSTGLGWPPHIPGTDLSFADQTVHRNKRSLTLDLRAPADREVFLELVATADVMIENFRPGTLESWGVGWEACRRVKPDLVYVAISGWGLFGPWSDRAGYDPAALAASPTSTSGTCCSPRCSATAARCPSWGRRPSSPAPPPGCAGEPPDRVRTAPRSWQSWGATDNPWLNQVCDTHRSHPGNGPLPDGLYGPSPEFPTRARRHRPRCHGSAVSNGERRRDLNER